MKEEELARIQEKSDQVLAEDAQLDPEEPYYLAMEVPALLAEVRQLRNDAKWLFDDFAWEDHWRYCDLPEGECDQCKSLVEMKARYGWG